MLQNNEAQAFETNLNNLINRSGLTVSEAYYIVENAALQLKLLYQQLIFDENFEGDHEVRVTEDLTPIIEDSEEIFETINK